MAFNWDTLISILIISGLILTIWAKISNQTIVELLRELREFFQDIKEETTEDIPYYE